ncbi:hypothetical protein DICPUDRAFT_78213 [Dictyostelium purpureum]|uniref:Uncharacterized protein n=1 Tax=Dictyostelium purpureum TaxID=5786 RepID=F0ZIW5_DICPU|nr:uncharacterized protein DICPUDRAFT_78213 [Dictyostelium purpureum]EGC36097.1 hypothetical protein DICPUDRAFT_78213 [Dictyostelium purpureum]|eukprot:XP_003287354.1 hypothetical protein DICPUDRAFT_78213 [Dictyostelium purpureum]
MTFSEKNSYLINGSNINNIDSFYKEINRLFMGNEDFQISNLDGLEDLFSGGVGDIDIDQPIQIVWKDFEKNRIDLGKEVTIEWYEDSLKTKEFNHDYFKQKIKDLQQDQGQTYFDIILEIMEENENIKLIKE